VHGAGHSYTVVTSILFSDQALDKDVMVGSSLSLHYIFIYLFWDQFYLLPIVVPKCMQKEQHAYPFCWLWRFSKQSMSYDLLGGSLFSHTTRMRRCTSIELKVRMGFFPIYYIWSKSGNCYDLQKIERHFRRMNPWAYS